MHDSESIPARLDRLERMATRTDRVTVSIAQRFARLERAGAEYGAQLMQRLDRIEQRHEVHQRELALLLDRIDRRQIQFAEDLDVLAQAILGYRLTGGTITFAGLLPDQEKHMIIVKNDQVPVRYHITPPTVTDARGRPVPSAQLSYEVVSEPAPVDGVGPGIVVVPDPTDPLTGMVGPFNDTEDGVPDTCAITVAVKLADGTLVGSFGEVFTITPGDPAKIAGGTIAFEGLASV